MTRGDVQSSDVPEVFEDTPTDEDLSLADVKRKTSKPVRWVIAGVLVALALILPYWFGRTLAANHTQEVSTIIGSFNAPGLAFLGWAITVVMFTGIAMAVVLTPAWPWILLFAIALAVEQFISGICLFSFHFWYSTYVVYGDNAHLANAANAGILTALLGIGIYAIIFVLLIIFIKKESRFNELTRSWASFTIFYTIEFILLMILLFSGLLNIV